MDFFKLMNTEISWCQSLTTEKKWKTFQKNYWQSKSVYLGLSILYKSKIAM